MAQSLADLRNAIMMIDRPKIAEIGGMIADTTQRNGLVYVCGNGGSGATANMFAAAMVGISPAARSGVRVCSLNGNMAIMTESARSQGYHSVFSRYIQAIGRPGDLLVAISGSGNSPNVIEAVVTARGLGIKVVGLTGMGGGKLARMTDCCITVDSYDMEQIENVHSIVAHAITRCVEAYLGVGQALTAAT